MMYNNFEQQKNFKKKYFKYKLKYNLKKGGAEKLLGGEGEVSEYTTTPLIRKSRPFIDWIAHNTGVKGKMSNSKCNFNIKSNINIFIMNSLENLVPSVIPTHTKIWKITEVPINESTDYDDIKNPFDLHTWWHSSSINRQDLVWHTIKNGVSRVKYSYFKSNPNSIYSNLHPISYMLFHRKVYNITYQGLRFSIDNFQNFTTYRNSFQDLELQIEAYLHAEYNNNPVDINMIKEKTQEYIKLIQLKSLEELEQYQTYLVTITVDHEPVKGEEHIINYSRIIISFYSSLCNGKKYFENF